MAFNPKHTGDSEARDVGHEGRHRRTERINTAETDGHKSRLRTAGYVKKDEEKKKDR